MTDRDSEVRLVVFWHDQQVRERGRGEILDKVMAGEPWKGESQGSIRRPMVLTALLAARDSQEGQSPETGGQHAG